MSHRHYHHSPHHHSPSHHHNLNSHHHHTSCINLAPVVYQNTPSTFVSQTPNRIITKEEQVDRKQQKVDFQKGYDGPTHKQRKEIKRSESPQYEIPRSHNLDDLDRLINKISLPQPKVNVDVDKQQDCGHQPQIKKLQDQIKDLEDEIERLKRRPPEIKKEIQIQYVDKPYPVEKIKEVQVEKIIEQPVIKEITKEVYIDKPGPIQYIDQPVIQEVIQEVQVFKDKIIQKPQYIDVPYPVDRPVYMPPEIIQVPVSPPPQPVRIYQRADPVYTVSREPYYEPQHYQTIRTHPSHRSIHSPSPYHSPYHY